MLPRLLDPRPYFANLPDPRRETRNKLHSLQDIWMIVLSAVLSGVEDWVGIQTVAQEREAWLRGFLELPHGIPSHDTLSDVMSRMDPVAFRSAFTAWATDQCLKGRRVYGFVIARIERQGIGGLFGRRCWPGLADSLLPSGPNPALLSRGFFMGAIIFPTARP